MGRRRRTDLDLADKHPALRLISDMLHRRGDHVGVAEARALAITEELIYAGYIRRSDALREARKHPWSQFRTVSNPTASRPTSDL